MAKTITVTFENDMGEEELEGLREKIRMVLRGEAVPAAEVVGQWSADPSVGTPGPGKSPVRGGGGPKPVPPKTNI